MKPRGRPRRTQRLTSESQRQIERMWNRLRAINPELALSPPPFWRPVTRADCVDGPRPCPYIGCRHHLATHVMARGALRVQGNGDPLQLRLMPDTCALDVAERGDHSLGDVARMLDMTRERVRQIQVKAEAALGRALQAKEAELARGPRPRDEARRAAACRRRAGRISRGAPAARPEGSMHQSGPFEMELEVFATYEYHPGQVPQPSEDGLWDTGEAPEVSELHLYLRNGRGETVDITPFLTVGQLQDAEEHVLELANEVERDDEDAEADAEL